MKVAEIIEKWIEENGFDGLYSPGNCGCEKSDLMPCDEYHSDCEPGYYVDTESEEYDPDYNFMIGPDNYGVKNEKSSNSNEAI